MNDFGSIYRTRKAWNDTCLAAGIPSISTDTSARIMAVLYVHGNNEAFTFNQKFVADMEYIQKRFHIEGAGTPSCDFVDLLIEYVSELEQYALQHKNESKEAVFSDGKPQWAIDLFKEMYNIKI